MESFPITPSKPSSFQSIGFPVLSNMKQTFGKTLIKFCVFFLFQFYLHNHLSFILYFHREKVEEGETHNYRVVRFEVVPQSVKVEGWYQHELSKSFGFGDCVNPEVNNNYFGQIKPMCRLESHLLL